MNKENENNPQSNYTSEVIIRVMIVQATTGQLPITDELLKWLLLQAYSNRIISKN
jgi:hypothetical protein